MPALKGKSLRWLFLLLAVLAAAAVPRGCDILWGNGPMKLYGKLVDQMGNPVPGAPVSFTAVARPTFGLPVPFYDNGESSWVIGTTTAKDGTFYLDAGWGRGLFPGDGQRVGYLDAIVPEPFNYGRPPPPKNFHGDPGHPVVFVHWNDAFKRIISRQKAVPIDSRWYTVSYRYGHVSPFGVGEENFEFRVVISHETSLSPFDWRLELDSPFPATEELADAHGPLRESAPSFGYVHSLRFVMDASDPRWTSTMTKRFYTQSRNRDVYGGVEITIRIGTSGAPTTATVRYTANFGRSRDLVPGRVTGK